MTMTTQTDTGIRDTIVRLNEKFMETYRRGDTRGMGELYTEDGQLLPPNSQIVRGRQAIGEFWGGAMKAGISAVRLETGEVEQQGDTAIEVSTATLYGEGDKVIDEAKYIVVWKREGGEWKLHHDMWNSNRPTS
jgi:uncharacterized protein (TIGR02246 family)